MLQCRRIKVAPGEEFGGTPDAVFDHPELSRERALLAKIGDADIRTAGSSRPKLTVAFVTWDGTNGLGGLLCGRKSVGRNKCALFPRRRRSGRKEGEGGDDVGEDGALGLVPSGARVHLALEVSLDDILRVPTEQRDGAVVEGIKDHRAIQPYPPVGDCLRTLRTLRNPGDSGSGSVPVVFESRTAVFEDFAASGCGDGFVERPVNQ